MAISSLGFKGTVGQSEDARRWGRVAPRFTVGSSTDLVVTNAAGDRTVSVSAGSAEAGAVLATSDAPVSVQLPANGAATARYDLIVFRYKWTDPITQPVFTYIAGVDGATGPNVAALIRTLGTQYDGVLAVVRVGPGQGTLTANDIFDARAWGGVAGPLLTSAPSAYQPLIDAAAGSELLVLGSGARYRHSGSTSSPWFPADTSLAGKIWRTAGSQDLDGNNLDKRVLMQASRLSPGFAFDAVNHLLVVPFDGLYDLSAVEYWTAASPSGAFGAFVCTGWIDRTRAGVAAVIVASAETKQKLFNYDDRLHWQASMVPLKAGDKLGLVALTYDAFDGSGRRAFVFGGGETSTCALTARYRGPLNGATPL